MFEALEKAYKWYQDLLYAPEMANLLMKERIMKFENLINLLKARRLDLAKLMTDEMGKPIAQNESEVDKAIDLIEYHLKFAEEYTKEENIKTDKFKEAFVSHQPLGPCLSKNINLLIHESICPGAVVILPWNFPLQLAFKVGVPALLGGNPLLVKHAGIVPQTA